LLRVLVKHALAGAFDSDEVKVLTDAFDQAWKAVEESGVCFASGTYKNATREILALRIIEIAQLGERDPNRLRDDASRPNEPQEHWPCRVVARIPSC
jgi:hypothetical protein